VTGATGPPGAAGTTVVRTDSSADALGTNDTLDVLVSCEPGEVLLGGGFNVQAQLDRKDDLGQVIPIQSGPTIVPNQWQASIIATANTGVMTLEAFVLCGGP
jgi:hypothetical protein